MCSSCRAHSFLWNVLLRTKHICITHHTFYTTFIFNPGRGGQQTARESIACSQGPERSLSGGVAGGVQLQQFCDQQWSKGWVRVAIWIEFVVVVAGFSLLLLFPDKCIVKCELVSEGNSTTSLLSFLVCNNLYSMHFYFYRRSDTTVAGIPVSRAMQVTTQGDTDYWGVLDLIRVSMMLVPHRRLQAELLLSFRVFSGDSEVNVGRLLESHSSVNTRCG